jgi:VanZ family protein
VGFLFLLFVYYGSLVPFDFHPIALDAAWKRFIDAPYLEVNIRHREDLIANVLLYVPIAFCLTGAFGGSVAAGVVSLVLCTLAGMVIEFTQVFFPGRTVSLNDMLANAVGAAAGVGLWWGAGSRLNDLASFVSRGGARALRAAAIFYVLAYLALSLFPYDLILNADEIQWKLDSGRYGLLFAREACEGRLVCASKLLAEIAAVVPLGMLMGMFMTRQARAAFLKAFIAGTALGAGIEIAQFFIVTGYSQGVSVLTRGAGMALGVAVHRLATADRLKAARGYLRPLVVLAALPYLVVLVALNGWFAGAWTGPAAAVERVGDISFLPFYYHYFTTESTALHSLLRIAAVYVPIGVGYWMWHAGAARARSGNPWIPALLAAALALVVEAVKLFVPDRKPDPTDVLIAGAAAYFACVMGSLIQGWRSADDAVREKRTPFAPRTAHVPVGTTHVSPSAAAGAPPGEGEPSRGARAPGQSHPVSPPFAVRAVPLPLLLAAAALVALYPYGAVLGCFLVVYAALIWRWPRAALPAVLALLPLLDFAPWTGWFFFDELDAALLVTAAILLRRLPAGMWNDPGARLPTGVVALLAMSYLVSALIGVLPLQPLDANGFASYLSHYNSLRTLKGFAWALVFAGPLVAQVRRGPAGQLPLVTGMLVGLTGVVAVAIWERHLFTGLLDFSTDHRTTSTFSGMHTGGAFIEGYLVLALPFLALWFHLRRGALEIVAGGLLFVLGTYVLMTTFARGGYLGYAAALAIVGVASIARKRAWPLISSWSVLAAVFLVGIGCAIALPVLEGSYMRGRWASVDEDAGARLRHWQSAVEMMDDGVLTGAFGMGLGRFPETWFYRNPSGKAPGTYRYGSEGREAFLMLGGGEGLYFGQRVAVKDHGAYVVQLDARGRSPGGALNVALCEKSVLYSYGCRWLAIPAKEVGTTWKRHSLTLDSGEIGAGGWSARPVELALTNTAPGTVVDVDNVRLLDAHGQDLVANGDFSRGNNHWFFSSDDHLAWHAKNLGVQIFFEQGVLGLIAFFVAVGYALARLAGGTVRGDLWSGVLFASLVAFLLVGLFDSLFDAPRLALLFYLLLFAGAASPLATGGDRGTSTRVPYDQRPPAVIGTGRAARAEDVS